MKQKNILRLFIAVFLVLSLLPSVGMFFQGEVKSSANEILTSKPRLLRADGSFNPKVLKNATDYIADRFAFRKQLITAWAELNAALLHTSAEDQVVLGRDSWLYYSSTLNDYMGRSLTEAELEKAAQNLRAIQDYAESRGASFIFTVAPNKNTLYTSNMPAYIPSAHENANLTNLLPYLELYGVHYVDLAAAFATQDETLYYATDSHWNDRGAALAADALLSALNRDSHFFSSPFLAGEGHRGDLYDMLYPTGAKVEPSFVIASGFSHSVLSDPNGGNAQKFSTRCAGKQGSLLCWRDSFGISLYPYLADSFEQATFSRSVKYEGDMIDDCGADTVILEIVERNLPQLSVLDWQAPTA